MNRQLKILFIPRWYPNRVNPLNGVFIQRHALSVAIQHKVAVLFVNADPNMKNKVYNVESTVEEGITAVRVYYNNSFPNIPLISSFIKFYRYLRACKIGIKVVNEKFGIPDVSHIHVLSRTFFSAFYYQFFYKTPFVVSEQWSGYLPEDGTYKGLFKKMLTAIAVRKASAVTTVSSSLKNAMLAHGLKNNYTVIPNVVDTKLFCPASEAVRKEKFILLHVSNLDDRAKNVSGMIRAVKKLSQTRSDFEFHIAGDGDQRNELEKLSRDLGLLNRYVFFLGTKKSAEIAELMRTSDLFLLFSNYDNMPCVMVEAFASGLPVIGSAIHGIKEHVQEGRGILVPPGEESALCDAISRAIDTRGSFDKKKLREYAKANFSYEAVGDQFDKIYQQIINESC